MHEKDMSELVEDQSRCVSNSEPLEYGELFTVTVHAKAEEGLQICTLQAKVSASFESLSLQSNPNNRLPRAFSHSC
jgi:hypothetical protein